MYTNQELAKLHSSGRAHKLSTGRIIPTSNPQELGAAITEARAAQGTGTPEDTSELRGHLVRTASKYSAQRLIPASWAREQAASKAAGRWDEGRVRHSLLDSIEAVADASGAAIKSMDIEFVTPAERAEAITKASGYRRTADRLTDRASADSYRELAKQTLQEVGLR